LKNILSYQDYISGSIKESLDPFITASRKYRIGESVKVKDRIGKITAIDGSNYLVMIGLKNERVKESDIDPLGPIKKNKAKPTRKKLPKTRDLTL
jgi:hypothetical protein